jgi:hypothetical protein
MEHFDIRQQKMLCYAVARFSDQRKTIDTKVNKKQKESASSTYGEAEDQIKEEP